MRRSIRVALAAMVALASSVSLAPTAWALGGPVILGGDDLTDHGSFDTATSQNLAGWLYLQEALENLKPRVTRANDGSIAALGSAPSTATSINAGAAVGRAGAAAGFTVNYFDGGPAMTQFFTDLRAGHRQTSHHLDRRDRRQQRHRHRGGGPGPH